MSQVPVMCKQVSPQPQCPAWVLSVPTGPHAPQQQRIPLPGVQNQKFHQWLLNKISQTVPGLEEERKKTREELGRQREREEIGGNETEGQDGTDCEVLPFLPMQRKKGQGGGCWSYSRGHLDLFYFRLPPYALDFLQQLPHEVFIQSNDIVTLPSLCSETRPPSQPSQHWEALSAHFSLLGSPAKTISCFDRHHWQRYFLCCFAVP